MKQIEMKCYGYLEAGDSSYVLLSPAPFMNEHYQGSNEVAYFAAYLGVLPSTPHIVVVSGTYHIDWLDTPETIFVEVPDNYEEKRSAPIQDFRPIEMIAEEDLEPAKIKANLSNPNKENFKWLTH